MKDKIVLITGASSGIGAATAKAFVERGARVMLAARREAELKELTKEIESQGGEAKYVVTDVSSSREVEVMVTTTLDAWGGLDCAVNNAGIEGTTCPIGDLDESDWDHVLDTNLKGCYLCMKYESRAMLNGDRGGAIVNVGSTSSFLGFAGGAAYAASKHGQIGLTTSASAELAPHGIRVNIVCPGFIDTPMHRRIWGGMGDKAYDVEMQRRVHMSRVGKPEEIARAILFLCSDEASYITGSTLTPDGGGSLTL